jgi:hypothetical protein
MTNVNELERLIAEKGIRCTSVYGAPRMDEKGMDGWTVTLRFGRRRMTIPFYKGFGHHGAEPTTYEVLDSILMDASAYDNARSFEDFASEFGYDADSRTAERLYKACGSISKRLRRFLADDFDVFANCER